MGSQLRNKLLHVAFALAIQPGMILPESHDQHQLDLSSEYLLDSKDLSQGGFHEL